MVHLLLRDRFVIQTSDPLQIVMERLEAHIEPPKTVRWTFDLNHAPYEGSVSQSGFQMSRIPIGRPNASEPYIKGRFKTFPEGTAIYITLTLHRSVLIFLGCWYPGWYGLHLLIWSSGSMNSDIALYHFGLPLFILVFFWISFWIEAERTRNALLRIILRQRPKARQERNLMLYITRGIILILSIAFSFSFMADHISQTPPTPKVPESFLPR